MAGIENDIVVLSNVDVSNTSPPNTSTNGFSSGGQLMIGTDVAQAVKIGSITSPLGTLSIGYSDPNVTIDLAAGGIDIDTLITDVGGNVTPDASGNVTVTGQVYSDGSVANTLTLGVSASLYTFLYGNGNNTDMLEIGPLTNGQLLIGSTGAAPVAGTLTAGSGISITNGAGSITVATVAGGLGWVEETTTSRALVVDQGVVGNNAATITMTLPATAAQFSIFRFVQKGAGAVKIAQNAGQTIHFGNTDSTTGAGGYIEATAQWDAVHLICTTANTDFAVLSSTGNWTIV
jgi:hypothetical protein